MGVVLVSILIFLNTGCTGDIDGVDEKEVESIEITYTDPFTGRTGVAIASSRMEPDPITGNYAYYLDTDGDGRHNIAVSHRETLTRELYDEFRHLNISSLTIVEEDIDNDNEADVAQVLVDGVLFARYKIEGGMSDERYIEAIYDPESSPLERIE
jgi:hypothetical protein